MSHEITRWPWPRVSWYVDAVSDERLSKVTRSVSLLALCSPRPADSSWVPDGTAEDDEAEDPAVTCTDKLLRLSSPTVYGRLCGARRRTASRCSWALLLDAEAVCSGGDAEEADAVAAAAMPTAGAEEKAGGEDSCSWKGDWGKWWWWRREDGEEELEDEWWRGRGGRTAVVRDGRMVEVNGVGSTEKKKALGVVRI